MPGMFLSILFLKSGCLSLVRISKVGNGRAVFRDRSQLDRCATISEHREVCVGGRPLSTFLSSS